MASLVDLSSRLYWYKAYVNRVIDADTLVMYLDLGAGHALPCTKYPGGPEARYPQGRYRLWGINAPETRTPEGPAATARVKELLAQGSEGNVVYVKTYKVGGRGRLVVDVFVPRADAEGSKITPIHLSGALLDEQICPTYAGKPRSYYWPTDPLAS